jgi:tetratricopeptide (TPR) repeat protein
MYTVYNKIRQFCSGSSSEKKLTINFTGKKSLFDIKSESLNNDKLYNACLSDNSLVLGLKKSNCIAWVDIPENEYQDHVIEARFRLDSFDGYAAAGIIFRIMDDDTYYMALVSSKGYFRLDIVKHNAPKTLIAWTEISDISGDNTCINLKIITYGTCLIFIVNGKWLGEVNDNSIIYGRLGFAAASYQEAESKDGYVCKAILEYISIDERIKTIENEYKKWSGDSNINAEERLRLAETFAVMGESLKALEQINRAWKRRDDVIRSIASSYTEVRTQKELLLAARMSFRLGQYKEAEEYIDLIIEQERDTEEKKLAYTEKLKILNELNKFSELKEFVLKYQIKMNKDAEYYLLLARCHWQLHEYIDCAGAWDKVFEINNENKIHGVYAVNAANAHELAGNNKSALNYYIDAGNIFLNHDSTPELAAVIPKLSMLGDNNWEARALVGKWFFSIEDYNKSANEFKISEEIRKTLRPRPKADPAAYYLWGLVYYFEGEYKTAIRLIEKAVKLAPEYDLFRIKLEEIKNNICR